MRPAPMLSPEFFEDMFATYAWLRENEPVHWIEPINTWFISRHEDASRMLMDNENFSVEKMPIMDAWHPDVKAVMLSLFTDDPDHARLRGVVNDFFMPANVMKLEEKIKEIVDQALAGVKANGKGVIDIEKEYAYTIPIDVLSMIMGLPKEDYHLFHAWAPQLAEALQPMQSDEEKENGGRVAREIRDYLLDLFERGNLKPDGEATVMSLLKDAADNGAMHEHELITQAVQLYIGGHETTLSLIGKCIYLLLSNPSELEKFRGNPALASKVVDETVRFHGVSHIIGRRVAKEYTLHGVTMRPDDMVFVGNASANRDPNIFDQPDEFIVDRSKGRAPHLGFGRGARYCLGNHLAKLETRHAITALFDAFPNIELAPEYEPKFGTNLMLHGILSLPVKLN